MRSGHFYLTNAAGVFRYAGQWGNIWSSRSGAAGVVYYLHFGPSEVNPSVDPPTRYNGFSLRCLSTVLGMWYNWEHEYRDCRASRVETSRRGASFWL